MKEFLKNILILIATIVLLSIAGCKDGPFDYQRVDIVGGDVIITIFNDVDHVLKSTPSAPANWVAATLSMLVLCSVAEGSSSKWKERCHYESVHMCVLLAAAHHTAKTTEVVAANLQDSFKFVRRKQLVAQADGTTAVLTRNICTRAINVDP